eukprot:TRINITY_DN77_c2_g1_i1.p1 TRINITY_DN77_c2_g1~~TRINITY_DN77_c2_g1_i1.p1  ORF type:complete len:945 (-),score=187.41 TRINITY_DN77_c2_g1_i1:40-2874(-)
MSPSTPGAGELPGGVYDLLDTVPVVSFGDLFQTLGELLPHEASLCGDALRACRGAERLASVPLGVLEASSVCDSLVALVDQQHFARGAECYESVQPLRKFAQRVSRLAYSGGLAPAPPVKAQSVSPRTSTALLGSCSEAAAMIAVEPTSPGAAVAAPVPPRQLPLANPRPPISPRCSPRSHTSDGSGARGPASERSAGSSGSFTSRRRSNSFGSARRDQNWRTLPFFPDASHGGLRARLFVLFDDATQSLLGKFLAFFLMVAIGVSTIAFVVESIPELRERPAECARLRSAGLPLTVEACEPVPYFFFSIIEAVCIIIFSVDYIVRMLTVHAVADGSNRGGLMKTLRYFVEPLNMIDLCAVAPFYVGLMLKVGAVKIFRLVRALRLFKMVKHHSGILLFADVMLMSGQPLLILVFFNMIITILFASLIYYAEGQRYSVDPVFTVGLGNESAAYPTGVFVRSTQDWTQDEPTPFRSIPFAIWWVFVTMTTVGYGDFSPTTFLGKCIGVVAFYVGIIFLALPIGILGNNFDIAYENMLASMQDGKDTAKTARDAKLMERQLRDEKEANLRLQRGDEGYCWFPRRESLRKSTFILLEDPSASIAGKIVSIFMILAILVSTIAFVLESTPSFMDTPEECVIGAPTVQTCRPRPRPVFAMFEVVSIAIFTLDYVLRIGTVHTASPEECGISSTRGAVSPLMTTVLYAAQGLNIIDILAIVPFYVNLAGGGGGGAAVLRVLRLVRIFRVLKMPKMRACAEMLIDTVVDSMPALVLVFIMTMLMCVMLASLIVTCEGSMYSVSHFTDEYPYGLYIRPTADGYGVEPSNFRSIPYAFWWFFATATTVGYGDDYPTTASGRLVGVVTFYTGIVLLALPINVVGGCFNKYYPDWVKKFASSAEASTPVRSPRSELDVVETRPAAGSGATSAGESSGGGAALGSGAPVAAWAQGP